MIPKFSAEDTFLDTKNSKGENVTVVVPKGTYISINTPGLHYNRQYLSFAYTLLGYFTSCSARYWKDPYKFDPSRFLGDWPRDAFLPFSGGNCILFEFWLFAHSF
jgi:hypothetical protein